MTKLELKQVHHDPRRIITEYNEKDFSVQMYEILTGDALGNLYHTRKTQTFVVISGGGKVLLQNTKKESRSVVKKRLSGGNSVKILPFVAHAFLLEPGTRMICVSSEPYDENNKDSTIHILV